MCGLAKGAWLTAANFVLKGQNQNYTEEQKSKIDEVAMAMRKRLGTESGDESVWGKERTG